MTDPAPTEQISLVAAEDAYGQEAWEAATAAVLRKTGRLTESDADSAVWAKLTRRTLDGIEVPPIGVPADVADPDALRPGRTAEWDVRAQYDVLDAARTNEEALVDLDNGVTSLWLRTAPDDPASTLERALAGVLLDLAPVVLDAPEAPVAAAEALVELLDANGVDPAPGTNLGADPIGALTAGLATDDDAAALGGIVTRVVTLAKDVGALALVVDGTAVHDLGASDAQELGYTMAAGAAYLRILTEAGHPVDEALGMIEFRYAATDEQFPTIAKLRAARRLWARVAELSGASEEARAQRQHVVTSRPMMSAYDPYVNMLRTTVAAFAAGAAGADSVTVLPFDSPLGVPEALGRRNARNTSALLISESHVARVADPAGGSYAVERLTDALAEAGWAELGRIDGATAGETTGVLAALADGSLRERIDAVVAEREQQIAHRRRPITGLSEFPNLAEQRPDRAENPLAKPVRRYGAAFEELRATPPEGTVFVATMGPVAQHTARATFAGNLFAAGGIDVVAAGATEGVADVVKAYDASPVVCLAGTDRTYADWGAELVAALREAGARHVVLAGKAGEETVPADLLDDSCSVGVDALTFLTTTREKLA